MAAGPIHVARWPSVVPARSEPLRTPWMLQARPAASSASTMNHMLSNLGGETSAAIFNALGWSQGTSRFTTQPCVPHRDVTVRHAQRDGREMSWA